VVELTFGLMLSLVREVARADATMKAGKWIKKELEGTELYGKTLGVIGFGRIGSGVGQRATAFGMKVMGYDPLISAAEITQRGGEPVSLDELYRQSDILTMHIPLTPESRGMMNADSFSKMKRGVLVVCAARGGVIDEDALLAALNSGQVGGAALDVFAAEPPGLTPLVAHPKLIATPHIGAQTVESQGRAAIDISNEILNALKGNPLRWKVA
jgi:D-3-phosphoglycerate dehydrogenase / 2-oxoglutarate reductase